MRILYIIRGLPGSGKSTLGETLTRVHGEIQRDDFRHRSFAADDYFDLFHGGKFVPSEIAIAHEWCQSRIESAMRGGLDLDDIAGQPVAVCNTFTQQWEIDPYIKLAKENDYFVVMLTMENNFGSVHDVPLEAIFAMKSRWEAMPFGCPIIADTERN